MNPKASTLKCKTQKGSSFQFFGAMSLSRPFFRICETFFRNFFKSSSGPLSIFWSFATEWMLRKPKGPPFTFYGTMRLLKILIFCFFLENSKQISKFLMSPKGCSLLCFDILQQTGFPKSPKSSLFYNFKNFALLEPWIWRRLYMFPSCFFRPRTSR